MTQKILFAIYLLSVLLLNPKYVFANTGQEETYTCRSDDFNLRQLDQFEIIESLSQIQAPHIRFHLYKELIALQLQSYRAQGGNINALASAIRIATTDVNKRQEFIDGFNEEEKEVFISYDSMLNLANELSINVLSRNSSFHFINKFDVKAIQYTEPFQLYYLQILELEESLNFQVHGSEFMIREQVAALTGILLCLDKEITAMQLKSVIRDTNDLTLEHKELNFYWTTIASLCHELLERLDSRWSQCEYNRLKILNLIFGEQFTFFYPYLEKVKNPIDLFFPYILKHADLQLVRERFNQINDKLEPWDQNFEWVILHIKAADYLLSSDPEKAKAYFEKAKKLTDETLWCYFFSFNQEHWSEKKEQALRIIEQHTPFFE